MFDSPSLDPDVLTQAQKSELGEKSFNLIESRINRLVARATESINTHRPEIETAYYGDVEKLQLQFKAGEISKDQYVVDLAKLNYAKKLLLDPNKKEILGLIGGMVLEPTEEELSNVGEQRIVLLPTKNNEPVLFQEGSVTEVLTVKFKPEADPDDSYPTPNDFFIVPSSTYPVKASSRTMKIFFVIRHELQHALGKGHPAADLDTLTEISNAFKLKNETGDTSGYWIVIKNKNGVSVGKRGTSSLLAA